MSESKAQPNFDERCSHEATRDVVFLLQARRWIFTGIPRTLDGEYGHDGEGMLLGDTKNGFWEPRENAEYLTGKQLAEMEDAEGVPCAIETWKTERVFLSREEGTRYGERRSYNYSDGWRVYGVPSEGELPKIIRCSERTA